MRYYPLNLRRGFGGKTILSDTDLTSVYEEGSSKTQHDDQRIRSSPGRKELQSPNASGHKSRSGMTKESNQKKREKERGN